MRSTLGWDVILAHQLAQLADSGEQNPHYRLEALIAPILMLWVDQIVGFGCSIDALFVLVSAHNAEGYMQSKMLEQVRRDCHGCCWGVVHSASLKNGTA